MSRRPGNVTRRRSGGIARDVGEQIALTLRREIFGGDHPAGGLLNLSASRLGPYLAADSDLQGASS